MAAQLQATAVFVTKENGEMCRVSFFEVDALPGGGDGGDGGVGAPPFCCASTAFLRLGSAVTLPSFSGGDGGGGGRQLYLVSAQQKGTADPSLAVVSPHKPCLFICSSPAFSCGTALKTGAFVTSSQAVGSKNVLLAVSLASAAETAGGQRRA